MTLKQRCHASEATLKQVSTALLEPRVETLEACEADLEEVIALLKGESIALSEGGVDYACPEDRSALFHLKYQNRLLGLQVQNALNLCQGLTQLGLAQGYTEQGRPAVPANEPLASYEV